MRPAADAESSVVDTAQLAIVVSGVVGIGSPIVAGVVGRANESQKTRRERAAHDVDDLREVLDGLLPVMFDHTNRVISLERSMQASAFGLLREEPAPETRASRRELYAANARLVVRRGRDDRLVRSLGDYLRVTDEAVAEIDQLWDAHEPFGYDDAQLGRRARSYWDAYEAFADMSTAVAGSAGR